LTAFNNSFTVDFTNELWRKAKLNLLLALKSVGKIENWAFGSTVHLSIHISSRTFNFGKFFW